MADLSVLCITKDPGPRVAAVLAPLREVADEIVVVADASLAAEDLAHYETVSDRVVRYEFAPPVERPYSWAHALCRGRWVFRIDGDEYASPELVERLPQLVARDDRLQYWFARRWCYPDAAHWLDERPWAPDFQQRLLRNEPALLSFHGRMHTVARHLSPYELREEPIYHLDVLLHPAGTRRAKAGRYEALRPGMQVPGGGPMEMFYLPEVWARRDPSPTPPEHLEGIAAVLAPEPASPGAPDLAGIAVAYRAEIDEVWEGRSPAREDYRAELECLDRDLSFAPGAIGDLTVRVHNRGDATWPGADKEPLIWLGHRWLDMDGGLVQDATPRSPLPAAVEGGGSALVRLALQAPGRPGRYLIEIDVVHEDVRWFDCPLRVEIWVRERRPTRP